MNETILKVIFFLAFYNFKNLLFQNKKILFELLIG